MISNGASIPRAEKIIRLASCPADLAVGDCVTVTGAATGSILAVEQTDPSSHSTCVGIAVKKNTSTQAVIQLAGPVDPGITLTPGALYYVSALGVPTATAPGSGNVIRLGVALAADSMLIDAEGAQAVLAHAATHATGGTDAIAPADIGAATAAALTSHTSSTSNPHSVVATQIGAVNAASVTTISPSNYTASAATIEGNLDGIDTALGGAANAGGSTTEVQYNDGGALAGAAAFTWNAGSQTLYANNIDASNSITGDLTGDVTGDLTGDVTGDLTGDVTGDVTGDLAGTPTAPKIILTHSLIAPGPTPMSGTLYTKGSAPYGLFYKDFVGMETDLTAGGGGGSPGGSDTQIQYNNSGAFGGSAASITSAGTITLPEQGSAPSTPTAARSMYVDGGGNVRGLGSDGIDRRYLGEVYRDFATPMSENIGPSSDNVKIPAGEVTTSDGPFFLIVMCNSSNTSFAGSTTTQGGGYAFKDGATTKSHNFAKGHNTKRRLIDGGTYKNNQVVAPAPANSTTWCMMTGEDEGGDDFAAAYLGLALHNWRIGLTFTDHSSWGLEFYMECMNGVTAIGIIDGLAGVAGTGYTPWDWTNPSPPSNLMEASTNQMLAHRVWDREGTLRNLTAADDGVGVDVTFDRLWVPSGMTTSGTGDSRTLTSWAADPSGADPGDPALDVNGTVYVQNRIWRPSQ